MSDQDELAERIIKIVKEIINDKGREIGEIELSAEIYEKGLGLDSLDTATFSVSLEKEFGLDPYSLGKFPRTLQEICDFYQLKRDAD